MMMSYNASRFSSVSFLESLRPGINVIGGKMTAATVTGPAIGPRPTSSTPAT